MIEYREHPPSPRFARHVECFWKIHTSHRDSAHLVLPDGCADIIFSRHSDESALILVGMMTSAQEFRMPRGQELFGVRFRPAMWNLCVPAPWPDLTDRTAPMGDIAGGAGDRLLRDLGGMSSVPEMVAAVEAWLGAPREESIVQKIARYIARRHGDVRIDDIAAGAGLSARQLLRLFVAQTGATPKQLCRVLRFRRSVQRLQSDTDCAQFALECGYYDQAHWINEFRELSGYTPGQYLARQPQG